MGNHNGAADTCTIDAGQLISAITVNKQAYLLTYLTSK